MSQNSSDKSASTGVSAWSVLGVPLWQIIILVGIFLILYLPVLINLVTDWDQDANYSHGFLIIPISAYLIWKKRAELKEVHLETCNWGLLLMLGSLLLFIGGVAGMEFFTTRVSMIGLLAGVILYLAGWRFLRAIWFPLAFLLFMIPVPYILYYSATFPLQLLGTKVASGVIGLLGIPHLRQGNIIHLPDNYSLEVAEACSGLRSLVTLLALAALIAYFFQRTKPRALILFFSAIPIAIAANIFRITVTAIGAYGISRKFAEDYIHELSGMIVFAFSLICLLILSSLLRMGRRS